MSTFELTFNINQKISEVIVGMSANKATNYIAGFAVITDKDNVVLGIITDGDIRRGLSKNFNLDLPLDRIMNTSPFTIVQSDIKTMSIELDSKLKSSGTDISDLKHVVIVDEQKRFIDVRKSSDFVEKSIYDRTIAVYGMGFVGLTLAATFASCNLKVIGIDNNLKVIKNLTKGIPSFFENGLDSLLNSLLLNKKIKFTSNPNISADVHIVSVGTPIGKNNKPSEEFLIEVTKTISSKIKQGDLVIYRSTVPVGTTRNSLIPILEESGLVAGLDFFVSFAPERTVEGNALKELRNLPQIIGALEEKSMKYTEQIFSKITNFIIGAQSIEEAEMVKLINNTFRDLVFAFSNEVSYICDELNINAFRLIEIANEGYPRNPIPSPSPGVGGLCLSKDPYLYSSPKADIKYDPILGKSSRAINKYGPEYVLKKMKVFANKKNLDFSSVKIFLIGLAFKGNPETSDIRDSMAMRLIELLPIRKNVFIKDSVVSSSIIDEIGCNPVEDFETGIVDANFILIMNNHPLNKKLNIFQSLTKASDSCMFFDGWNLFNQSDIEGVKNMTYSTMGYMTEF